MIELIGTNAGLVWNVLNEGGKMSFKAVKPRRLKRKKICTPLLVGWRKKVN
jgi:hypothetical protein